MESQGGPRQQKALQRKCVWVRFVPLVWKKQREKRRKEKKCGQGGRILCTEGRLYSFGVPATLTRSSFLVVVGPASHEETPGVHGI